MVDYRGRQYTYDGSDETHFSIQNYAAMDRGVDVFAVAKGTVAETHDGEFDRTVTTTGTPTNPLPENCVVIDHGGGWRTRYGRLRNGSVGVSPGQCVTAGQKLGQVGGSGRADSGDYYELQTWLRFEVTHDGQAVNPFVDAGGFWQSPPPYAGDSVGPWYMTTYASEPPLNELWEHLPRRHVFHPGERVMVGGLMQRRERGHAHRDPLLPP